MGEPEWLGGQPPAPWKKPAGAGRVRVRIVGQGLGVWASAGRWAGAVWSATVWFLERV